MPDSDEEVFDYNCGHDHGQCSQCFRNLYCERFIVCEICEYRYCDDEFDNRILECNEFRQLCSCCEANELEQEDD